MPDDASIQMVTAPSTIHAGCTRRIELTGLGYRLPAGRFGDRKKAGAEPSIGRLTPDARLGPASEQRARLVGRRGGHLRLEDDRVALRIDRDGLAIGQLALQEFERERILDEALDGPLERPRAER